MKYLFSSFALLAVLFLPVSVNAAEFKGGEDYTLPAGETIGQNLYSAGSNVYLAGDVRGDVFSAGSNITITGSIEDDVTLAAGNIQLLGSVGDDVRLAGGTIVIGGPIGGELMSAGGMITLAENSTIEGDVYVAGGQITINGIIRGDLRVEGDDVRLNGTVDGNVIVKAKEALTIGESTNILGNFTYDAESSAIIPDSASIGGVVEFREITVNERVPEVDFEGLKGSLNGVASFLKFMKLFTILASVLLVFFVFKKQTQIVTEHGIKNFGWDLLRGLVFFFVTPMISLILLFTFVGSTISVIAGVSYILSLLVSKIFGAVLVGSLLLLAFKKKGDTKSTITWQAALLGIAIFWLLGFVPYVGWGIKAIFTLTSLGSLLYVLYEVTWLKRS